MNHPIRTTDHWLVQELDEGRRREARHERASLARERRVMAERRREAQAPGVGITVALAVVAFVAGVVVVWTAPLPSAAFTTGCLIALAGLGVLWRLAHVSGWDL